MQVAELDGLLRLVDYVTWLESCEVQGHLSPTRYGAGNGTSDDSTIWGPWVCPRCGQALEEKPTT